MNRISLSFLLLFVALLAGCGTESSPQAKSGLPPEQATETVHDSPEKDLVQLENELLLGTWKGTAGIREIEVVVEAFDRAGGLVYGHTLVNGNKRIMEGWIEEAEKAPQPCTEVLNLTFEESGDHPMDGIYTLELVGHYTADSEGQACGIPFETFTGSGTWESISGAPDEHISLSK